jgi:hypothetical protein
MSQRHWASGALLVGGVIELIVALAHFLMPGYLAGLEEYAVLDAPHWSFVVLGVVAVGLCLSVFGALSIVVSRWLGYGDGGRGTARLPAVMRTGTGRAGDGAAEDTATALPCPYLRAARIYALSQGLLWLGRAAAEVAWPVRIPLFGIPNPTAWILPLASALALLFLAPALARAQAVSLSTAAQEAHD